jgi:hypothetical protein
VYLREYLGARRLLVGAKAVELCHLACVCTNILARDAFLCARTPWSCCIWCVSARVSWREAPSCGRQSRGVVPCDMYLHEYPGARRLLVGTKSAELLHLVCIFTSILVRDAVLRAWRPWSCCVWRVSARVSCRETPPCGREGHGVMAFGLYTSILARDAFL